MGVIGHPVRHSLSPVIHSRFIEQAGLDAVYLAFPVEKGGAGAFLEAAKRMEMIGFNITMPLKEECFRLVEPSQRGLNGAVNTVCLREGTFCGYNTDGDGFLRALAASGLYPEGLKVILLGTGGTAAALSHTLKEAGCDVMVCARNLQAAKVLATGGTFPFDRIEDACRNADLLVNATPLGMEGCGAFPSFDFLDALPRYALIMDMVYNPRQTGLLRAARERGLESAGGLLHLVHQAALSFALFTGITVDKEITLEIYRMLQKEETQV